MLSGSLLVQKGSATPAVIGLRTSPRADNGSNLALLNGEKATTADGDMPATTAASRARLSLRLDPVRHLRLKLLSAHLRTSVQEILTAALDAYLEDAAPVVVDKDCVCLRKGAQLGTQCQDSGAPRVCRGEADQPATGFL